jgi:hypothetical protein
MNHSFIVKPETKHANRFSSRDIYHPSMHGWKHAHIIFPMAAMLYYDSLYRMHDDMLGKKQIEHARMQERQARQRRLENQFDDLQELPALSSFLSISEAMEEQLTDSADTLSQGRDASGPKTRDGFERMRRSETCM